MKGVSKELPILSCDKILWSEAESDLQLPKDGVLTNSFDGKFPVCQDEGYMSNP